MKRTIFTLCFAIFSVSILFAQGNMLLEDYEDGKINFTDVINLNPPEAMDTAVVDNPFKTGINTSEKVWEWRRVNAVAPAVNQPWAGFYATLTNEIPAGYNRIEVKYLRTNSTSQLRMKVEGGITLEFDPVTPASATNTWETLVFDLAGNGITNITVLSFFPDFYEPVNATSVSYIDDIIAFMYPTAVGPSLSDKKISTYYSNGELRIANYAGRVRVFDLVGRKIVEGNALEGKLKVNLGKGIYIIGTSEGNGKISIQ